MNKDNGITRSLEENASVINAKILEFNHKLASLPASVRQEYEGVLLDLNEKNEHYQKKFQDYKQASQDIYQDMKIGMEIAWEDLGIAFESAKERIDKVIQ